MKKIKFFKKEKNTPMVVIDEYHRVAGYAPMQSAVRDMFQPRHGTSIYVAIQAMMQFNSGKRMRFIGSMIDKDSGLTTYKKPKKFLPAQVLRRIGESCGGADGGLYVQEK